MTGAPAFSTAGLDEKNIAESRIDQYLAGDHMRAAAQIYLGPDYKQKRRGDESVDEIEFTLQP